MHIVTQHWIHAVLLNFLLIREYKKKSSKKFEAAQQFPTIIIHLHIRMISEGSCDTEDWNNDAEN